MAFKNITGFKICRGHKTAQAWFVKELSLINLYMKVSWNQKIQRWCIYNEDESISHIVQHPKTKAFRDLDQRILRKVRIDQFFTHNATALDKYLEEDHIGLRSYLTRGLNGVSDYLSGWDQD